jgi:hypothetical protein
MSDCKQECEAGEWRMEGGPAVVTDDCTSEGKGLQVVSCRTNGVLILVRGNLYNCISM